MKDARKKHILIVDDSADNRLLLKTILEARGYSTDCTSNGQEALLLLNSSAQLPSAILLDLRMPVMDGLTFRRLQKMDQQLKDIFVIIMSGEDDMESIRLKTNAFVMQKPLRLSSLIELIDNLHSEQKVLSSF